MSSHPIRRVSIYSSGRLDTFRNLTVCTFQFIDRLRTPCDYLFSRYWHWWKCESTCILLRNFRHSTFTWSCWRGWCYSNGTDLWHCWWGWIERLIHLLVSLPFLVNASTLCGHALKFLCFILGKLYGFAVAVVLFVPSSDESLNILFHALWNLCY